MVTNTFYKIIASALITQSKQSMSAIAADGSASNYFFGNSSQISARVVIPTLMGSVKKAATSGGQAYGNGVFFGDGTTLPTPNDYKLSGNVITTFTHTVVSITSTSNENGVSTTALYNITNTGSEPITISEIGLFSQWYRTSNQDYYAYLIDRTLLEVPVTIDPNGIGQITYTIRMNYPVVEE